MNTATTKRTTSKHKSKRDRIDLGIAILGILIKPGECLTKYDIAAFADCTKQNIDQIERSAIAKVKNALSDNQLVKKARPCVVCGGRCRSKFKDTCSVICGFAKQNNISLMAAESLLPDYVWK
jgi:hypothetical protein